MSSNKIKRPFIFMNMAISLDGKIASYEKKYIKLASDYDRKVMNRLRARADAVLIGPGTLAIDDQPIVIREKSLVKNRASHGRSAHPLNVAIAPALDFDPTGKFMKYRETEKLFYCNDTATKYQATAVIENGGEVHRLAGTGKIDLKLVVDDLYERGVRMLLLEGGGGLNFAMLQANLVDEIYLTYCPLVIGGKDAPTFVEGKGFSVDEIRQLELTSFEKVGDEFYFSYRLSNSPFAPGTTVVD